MKVRAIFGPRRVFVRGFLSCTHCRFEVQDTLTPFRPNPNSMASVVKHYGKWRVRWVDEAGQRRSAVFNAHTDALAFGRRQDLLVRDILSGAVAPTPPRMTFDQLCDHYIECHSALKRRRRDDESIIRAHLRPFFGTCSLDEVGHHVDRFRAARQHLNPKTLHNQLTLLISMLRVAHDRGWLVRLPKIKKPKISLCDTDFSYLRTVEERDRFLRSAFDEEEQVYTLYTTATFTGMRCGEVAGLRWDCVDFERRLIHVIRSYEGPTKSGKGRFVPILDPLLPVLRAWRLKSRGDFVFINRSDKMYTDSSRIFQEVFQRVLQRAGFPRGYITFHDLRHTFASHWMMGGGGMFDLQKILGHSDPKMTMRYAHLSPEAFAKDYARLGSEPPVVTAVVLPFTHKG